MPNWCWNRLKIIGPRAELDALLAQVGRAHGDDGTKCYTLLESLAPIGAPQAVTEDEEDQGTPDLGMPSIDEQIDAWSVKWGDIDTQLAARSARSLTFTFDTAWGPPIAGITTIARRFPRLRFRLRYDEPGNRVAGEAVWQDGQCVSGDPEVLPGVTGDALARWVGRAVRGGVVDTLIAHLVPSGGACGGTATLSTAE